MSRVSPVEKSQLWSFAGVIVTLHVVGWGMAAIAAREAQLQGSLEKWGAIPLLASKFAWVSVFALLLSGTWLVGRQQASGAAWTPTDLAGETLVDRHPAPVDNDEVLNNLGERTE